MEQTGIDGGKTKGRKRRIVVDVRGRLLSVKEQFDLDVDISEKINPQKSFSEVVQAPEKTSREIAHRNGFSGGRKRETKA